MKNYFYAICIGGIWGNIVAQLYIYTNKYKKTTYVDKYNTLTNEQLADIII